MLTPEQAPFDQPTKPFPLCAAQCSLLAEASHRTANQFALLSAYIRLSLEEFRKHPGEVRDLQLAFAATEARAGALASLNRQLMARPTTNHPVDVSTILHEVCATFSRSNDGGDGVFPSVVVDITGSFLVTPGVNMAVGQMVTEALMNALKYAYPKDQAGEIKVRSARTKSGELLIEVIDRGVNVLPGSLIAATNGFGVRLMRGLASQENIGLTFVAASPGLSVQFVLPPAGREPIARSGA